MYCLLRARAHCTKFMRSWSFLTLPTKTWVFGRRYTIVSVSYTHLHLWFYNEIKATILKLILKVNHAVIMLIQYIQNCCWVHKMFHYEKDMGYQSSATAWQGECHEGRRLWQMPVECQKLPVPIPCCTLYYTVWFYIFLLMCSKYIFIIIIILF